MKSQESIEISQYYQTIRGLSCRSYIKEMKDQILSQEVRIVRAIRGATSEVSILLLKDQMGF
jgi:hypothetical protein